MARRSTIDVLQADIQAVPAGVEVVRPPSELEAKLAREGMELNRRGIADMMAPPPGPKYPLIENIAQVKPPIEPEVVKPNTPVMAKAVEPAKPDPVFVPQTVAPADHETMQAARVLVRKLRSLSYSWEAKVEAMRSERHLTDEQICIALMAHTLDTDAHLIIPADHPFFSEHFEPAGRTVHCVICDELLTTAYPGQPPVCILGGRGCGIKWNSMTAAGKAELLEAVRESTAA